MTLLAVLARSVLAVVFVVSAVAKLRDRSGARTAVEQFGIPQGLVGAVAAGLPVAELACAGLLLGGDPAPTAGAVGAALLLVAFTAAVVRSLRAGRRFDCHCFGQVGSGVIGWPTVARNAVLLVLVGLSLVGAGSLGSVPAEVVDAEIDQPVLAVAVAVLSAAVIGLGLVLRTLMSRYGAVLLRVEALEVATGTAPPKEAPPFSLPDLDGGVVDLDGVLDDGKPVLLVFISPSCHLCADLVPELESWQRDPQHPVSVVVLSSGSVAANGDKLAGAAVRVALQDDWEVATAYGVDGTPAAVVIGTDGLIAGAAANGVGAVLSRHAMLVQTVGGAAEPPPLHQIVPRPATPGDELPELVVTTEGGAGALMKDVCGDDAVLLFWRSTCGFCAAIAGEVAALESTAPVVLVTDTEPSILRASGLTSPVVREHSGALSIALRVPGTPAAVRVTAGALASGVVAGGPAVLDLLRSASRADKSDDVARKTAMRT